MIEPEKPSSRSASIVKAAPEPPPMMRTSACDESEEMSTLGAEGWRVWVTVSALAWMKIDDPSVSTCSGRCYV